MWVLALLRQVVTVYYCLHHWLPCPLDYLLNSFLLSGDVSRTFDDFDFALIGFSMSFHRGQVNHTRKRHHHRVSEQIGIDAG